MKGPHHETLRLLLTKHTSLSLAKAMRDTIADAAAPTDIETQVQLQPGETGLQVLVLHLLRTVDVSLSQLMLSPRCSTRDCSFSSVSELQSPASKEGSTSSGTPSAA